MTHQRVAAGPFLGSGGDFKGCLWLAAESYHGALRRAVPDPGLPQLAVGSVFVLLPRTGAGKLGKGQVLGALESDIPGVGGPMMKSVF